ncbi:hypothetical protein FDE76_01610 [Clostridium botulinum]|uniref:DUF4393 domain-containing protein n=1 Tax=Clostridium botulinum (strain Eklund 17B / Type B) TaxID=935198 RepID=B2TME4_CLOBB|nr:hypothetical protein CLL_A0931 [Clostridium botulinum B str. Eklund 17B (NRP)]MBY6976797.1 hypothetical protein [Clostridium botulinum]MBY7002290.1 hypothetical protein [Clostridium botulinum]MCR1274107.1 hypothetical protein [Clostridium botulinum]NFD68786.1 hypothetical protein [Clostridium botulinum]
MNDELIPSFKKSLFDESIDIGSDLMELPIDLITENEVIKDIPVVGTIVKLGKAAITIRERHLIKKLVAFIESVNNDDVESDVLEKHKQMLEANPKQLNKELEGVLILVDRQLEIEKTKILAELYKSYISKKMAWSDFIYLSEILEKFFLRDVNQLELICENKYVEEDNIVSKLSMFRLESIGLVEYFSRRTSSTAILSGQRKQNQVKLTGYGKLLYECSLRKLINNGTIGVWI